MVTNKTSIGTQILAKTQKYFGGVFGIFPQNKNFFDKFCLVIFFTLTILYINAKFLKNPKSYA